MGTSDRAQVAAAATGATMPLPVPDLEGAGVPYAVADGGRPELLGSRCAHCGLAAFPVRHACSGCGRPDPEPVGLGGDGSLYSYAAVHVSATRTTPLNLGYVDLTSGPRVLARITATEDELSVDLPVVLVIDEEGWAFAPTSDADDAVAEVQP
jgi:uncharacterized OB-fold protein